MFSCAINTKKKSIKSKSTEQKTIIIINTKYDTINVYEIKNNFKLKFYDAIKKNGKKGRYKLDITDKFLVTNLNLTISNIKDFSKIYKQFSSYDSAVLIKFKQDKTIIRDLLLYMDDNPDNPDKKNYTIENLDLETNLCNICMEEFSLNCPKDIFNCNCCPIICEICANKLKCCPYCRKQKT
tara:strand:- start:102 stop:647 length:546 start_codon:yes stop_codon:yes gene_type:complete